MPLSRIAVLAVLVAAGIAGAAEFFGENLVDVKLSLPRGDTYLRGTTDPIAELYAEITLTNVTEKEKRDKEVIQAPMVHRVSVDELIAIEAKLRQADNKDDQIKAIEAVTEKKKYSEEKELHPINQKSIGVAYVEPQLGPHDVIDFIITKLPEEGEAVPENAKPVIVPRDNKPDMISRVDVSPIKYLAPGESSPAYTLPVGKYYVIREPGQYSIKAVLRTIGNSTKEQKNAESNEEKFRVLPFKVIDQKIEELQRNWESFERGYPNFAYLLYQVKTNQAYDEVYWVQRIMVRGIPTWEWQRLCTVKAGTQAQVAHLGAKKAALLAVHHKGDAGLYTLDFSAIGPKVTAKIIEVKEGALPKLKIEAGVPAVE